MKKSCANCNYVNKAYVEEPCCYCNRFSRFEELDKKFDTSSIVLGVINILSVIMLVLFLVTLIFGCTYKVDAEYIIHGETILKKEYVKVIEDVTDDFGISPEFVMAMCEYESGGDAGVVNYLGCTGLMQIYPKYNSDRIDKHGVTNLKDPRQNVTVGCDLLHELFEKYEDPALVLMIYHGESKAQKKYDSGQISSYAKKILDRACELERMRGK